MGYGPADTLKDLSTKLAKSVVLFSIVMVIMLAIPIAMIVMGVLYLDDCRAERMIPIYLIVAGAFSIARSLISMCNRRAKESPEERNKMDNFISVIDCFLFAWFIAGCVFIYRTKDNFQSDDNTASDYCDYTFYWFSFWITTVNYIIMGVVLLALIIAMCCAAC